jgi:MFS family permease
VRPGLFLGAAVVVVVVAFQLWVSPSNPPGFHHDEAAFGLNAYTIGHSLRGQDGARLPLLLPSYGDYKSSAFSYVLAPVVDVFGPRKMVVRSFAAALGLLAALAVAAAVHLRFRRWPATLATLLVAGLTPWLFQVTRVAYDTSMYPFAVALAALAIAWWSAGDRRRIGASIAVAAALAFVTYGYAAGRLLGVLLALSLVVFLRRGRGVDLVVVWAVYAVLLVPMLVYRLRHPAGLTARYHQTTFVTPDQSSFAIFRRAAWNWIQDIDPFYWLIGRGDPKPYTDVAAGQLLAVSVVLALVGIGVAIVAVRRDRWSAWLVLGLALAAIPASLTPDRHDTLRLAAVPVFYLLLVGVAVSWLARRVPARAAILATAVGVVLLVGQWAFFVQRYDDRGPGRTGLFDADVPSLLARALSDGATIYIDHDDAYAQTYARWYALEHRIAPGRVSVLADGGIAPTGSMVFGRTQDCDYVCNRLAEADSFWIARAAGPKPAS